MKLTRSWARCSAGIAISIILLASAAPSKARSLVKAVLPNQPVQQGLQVEVSRIANRKLSRSDFTVEVIAKETQLPSEFTATLSSVQIEDAGMTINGIRQLDCTTDKTVLCRFIVSDEMLLETPDLGFVLTIPVISELNGKRIPMPSADTLYFNLKDIPASEVSIWEKLWLFFSYMFMDYRDELHHFFGQATKIEAHN
jgi:hypothetical protein